MFEKTRQIIAGPNICESPIFILGRPRSGTTNLAFALSQHSQLWTSGESYALFNLFAEERADEVYLQATTISEAGWFVSQSVSRAEFLMHLGLGMNALFTSRTGGRRWIDHTPHYALMADLLAEMFPKAMFVHILKDARKVIDAMMRSAGNEKSCMPLWAEDFREACRTWQSYVAAMVAFEARHPGRCLTVRDERLAADTSAEFGRIFEFLGVADQDEPASFFRSDSDFASAQPGDAATTTASPWIEWAKEQQHTFAQECGALAVELGYCAVDTILKFRDAERDGQRDPRSEAIANDAKDNALMRGILRSALSANSNCIDVGCHYGSVLREILKLSPGGRHIAYEPLPDLYRKLKVQFPGVDVRCAALSDHSGQASFVHVKTNPGYSGFRERTYAGEEELETITVRVESLDSTIPDGYAPALIKIDVEGAELEVLRGAIRTIEKFKPIIIFEHGRGAADHYGTGPADVFNLLVTRAGLRITDFDGNGPFSSEEFGAIFNQGKRFNFVARPPA